MENPQKVFLEIVREHLDIIDFSEKCTFMIETFAIEGNAEL